MSRICDLECAASRPAWRARACGGSSTRCLLPGTALAGPLPRPAWRPLFMPLLGLRFGAKPAQSFHNLHADGAVNGTRHDVQHKHSAMKKQMLQAVQSIIVACDIDGSINRSWTRHVSADITRLLLQRIKRLTICDFQLPSHLQRESIQHRGVNL